MKKVLVPLAEGCEELEAITIINLLRRAEIEVITASLSNPTVKCSRGTPIVADKSLDEIYEDEFDMVVLPGGLPGADYLNSDQRIHKLLKKHNEKNKFIAAICAAPKVLASAGLLDNKKATCYPGAGDENQFENVSFTQASVVEDNNVITSRGPGTAMDFALSLIEKLAGKNKRDEVENGLKRTSSNETTLIASK